MKYLLCISIVFVSVMSLMLGGCTANGKVTDFNKKSTDVSSMRLSGPGTLKVYDGNAVRNIDLKGIKTLRMQTDETKTYNRELFCLTEIILKDGSRIGSFNKDRAKAYVAVNSYLYGKTEGGEYRILLNDVSKIEFGY